MTKNPKDLKKLEEEIDALREKLHKKEVELAAEKAKKTAKPQKWPFPTGPRP